MQAPIPTPDEITAVVLAGGAGRRMGGRDKGLVLHQGRELIEHVHARIAPQVGKVLWSIARNRATYESLARTRAVLLEDAVPGHAGPLAGIALLSLNAWLSSRSVLKASPALTLREG